MLRRLIGKVWNGIDGDQECFLQHVVRGSRKTFQRPSTSGLDVGHANGVLFTVIAPWFSTTSCITTARPTCRSLTAISTLPLTRHAARRSTPPSGADALSRVMLLGSFAAYDRVAAEAGEEARGFLRASEIARPRPTAR
jgi:hypothetical protein